MVFGRLKFEVIKYRCAFSFYVFGFGVPSGGPKDAIRKHEVIVVLF